MNKTSTTKIATSTKLDDRCLYFTSEEVNQLPPEKHHDNDKVATEEIEET